MPAQDSDGPKAMHDAEAIITLARPGRKDEQAKLEVKPLPERNLRAKPFPESDSAPRDQDGKEAALPKAGLHQVWRLVLSESKGSSRDGCSSRITMHRQLRDLCSSSYDTMHLNRMLPI